MGGSASTQRRADSPLHGAKVLEVEQYIAGPFAGQQLADLGADVIKIERPGEGDPFGTYVGGKNIKNYGINYRAFNRNKKSVVLDLQEPRSTPDPAAPGRQHGQNFRPGVMADWGSATMRCAKATPA